MPRSTEIQHELDLCYGLDVICPERFTHVNLSCCAGDESWGNLLEIGSNVKFLGHPGQIHEKEGLRERSRVSEL